MIHSLPSKKIIKYIFFLESTKYGDQSVLPFNEIAEDKTRIDWNNFLDFLIDNMNPKVDLPVQLTVGSIESASHMSVSIF